VLLVVVHSESVAQFLGVLLAGVGSATQAGAAIGVISGIRVISDGSDYFYCKSLVVFHALRICHILNQCKIKIHPALK
jgi:uncharacterized protein YqgC (DUF456 family)